jgi:hypothetical protein
MLIPKSTGSKRKTSVFPKGKESLIGTNASPLRKRFLLEGRKEPFSFCDEPKGDGIPFGVFAHMNGLHFVSGPLARSSYCANQW